MKNFALLCAALGLAALAVPAAAQYHCFYGNLHAHTSYSDGIGTPDSAYAYAKNVAHVDVEALTEHNNGQSYTESAAHFQNEKLVADSMTIPGVFVALAGIEIGSEGSAGFGHINVWEPSALSPYFNTAGSLPDCYQWIADQGVPAQFNHPGASYDNIFNHLYYYPEFDQTMSLIEVYNSVASPCVFEDKMLLALQKGWRLGVSASQDNHHGHWGDQTMSGSSNIPLTGIWADTLTKRSVLDALLARRTFAELTAAGDRIQLSLAADGHWMGDRYVRTAGKIELVADGRSQLSNFVRLDLYSDGDLIDSMSANSTVVSWRPQQDVDVGSHYFMVKATQASGGVAWSSPVFVEVPSKGIDQKVATWPTPVTDGARIVFFPLSGVSSIKVSIYNLAGTRIWQTTSSDPAAAILWDGRDQRGNLAANGIYYILVEQSNASQTTISKGKTMVSR
ncbi:MAG TPA: FlgD immunoglobulin-like domain containing protein [Candidatus Edwardsbacteria bacterium]|nr:FlgD immunoglobulin-like domain containing protein [Candidatus Edwardsbacteria bacterium]